MARRPTKTEGDHADALRSETEKVTAKVDHAFEKLAMKLRDKADRSKAKLDGTSSKAKRAALSRRFELYADAANHLESRYAHRRAPSDKETADS
jgi:hypothetical protein